MSGGADWICNVQKRAFDRIKCYWLPRTCQLAGFSRHSRLTRCNHSFKDGETAILKDGETAILKGLTCNLIAGEAFLFYLNGL